MDFFEIFSLFSLLLRLVHLFVDVLIISDITMMMIMMMVIARRERPTARKRKPAAKKKPMTDDDSKYTTLLCSMNILLEKVYDIYSLKFAFDSDSALCRALFLNIS